MRRLAYAGLITVMTFTPLAVVWSSERGPVANRSVSPAEQYQRSSNFYYFGGGRGGWLGNSYGWGKRDRSWGRSGSSGRYRSGGTKSGGK